MSIKSRRTKNRKMLKRIIESEARVTMEPPLDIYPNDIKEFFETHLKIVSKNGETIPFIPNEHQCEIIDIVQEWADKNAKQLQPTLTVQVLKSRQIGCSTLAEGLMFYFTCKNKNFNGLVVAHDGGTSQALSDMCNKFIQHMPNRPMVRPSRGKGVKLENPTQNREAFISNPGHQSRIDIGTSLDKNCGSGRTYRFLHLSELSKWRDAETVKASDTLTSVLNTVPKYGAVIIQESTAFGMGIWYDLCTKTMNGENNYRFVFIPWYKHSEYTSKFESEVLEVKFEESLDEEEIDLKAAYNLTLEQLKWRRETIDDKLQGSVDKFHQEYPSNYREAFLTSGHPVFNRTKLDERRRAVKEELKKNSPRIGMLIRNIDGSVKFIDDKNGYLTIYEQPKKKYPYCIGSDIGDGVELDYSTASVGDNTNKKQVAAMRSNTILPTDWREEVIKLAEYYNNAYICAENNRGNFSNELWNDGYYNLYRPKKKKTSFRKYARKSDETGFTTTENEKYRIIEVVRSIVNENPELIQDITTIDEMLTFVFLGKGNKRMGNQLDCHDDLVIAYALMVEMMECGQQSSSLPDYMFNNEYENVSDEENKIPNDILEATIEQLKANGEIKDRQSED